MGVVLQFVQLGIKRRKNSRGLGLRANHPRASQKEPRSAKGCCPNFETWCLEQVNFDMNLCKNLVIMGGSDFSI